MMQAIEPAVVSVIVPVYNTEPYLRRCLQTILEQTYTFLEVILVDDGSTDNSARICKEFVSRDSRFFYIRQENRGVSSARNVGLERATGRYVSIVDSDDWLEADLYSKVVPLLESNEFDVVFFDYFVDWTDGRSRRVEANRHAPGVLDRTGAARSVLVSPNGFAWSRVYRRCVLSGLKFRTDLHWGEETLFVLRSLERVNSAYYLCDALYHYVQSEGSATRGGFNARRLSGIRTARAIIAEAQEEYPELEEHAFSFYGTILTELLLEVADDSAALGQHGPFLKKELVKVLSRLAFSKKVPPKQKAKWLVGIVNVRALARARKHTIVGKA